MRIYVTMIMLHSFKVNYFVVENRCQLNTTGVFVLFYLLFQCLYFSTIMFARYFTDTAIGIAIGAGAFAVVCLIGVVAMAVVICVRKR